MQLWSEFNPVLYNLAVNLNGQNGEYIDNQSVDFGMREFKANGTSLRLMAADIFKRNTRMLYLPAYGIPSDRCQIMGEGFANMQRLWIKSYALSFLVPS